MSELLGYSTYDLYYTNSFHIYAIVLFIFFYLSIMKVVFNTYSITTAYSNYQANSKIRKRYYDLFTTRDNLLYHISWAKSRNDHDEAKNMLVQLKHVDEEIDMIESSNRQIFGNKTKAKTEKNV